jgi:hypothetical protein
MTYARATVVRTPQRQRDLYVVACRNAVGLFTLRRISRSAVFHTFSRCIERFAYYIPG